MRRRLFWLLLGWSFGVLASNWMENRFRKTVNRYARNTVSRLGFMPEEILSKRSEVSGWFRERFTNRESDFFPNGINNFRSRPVEHKDYLRKYHRPVRPQNRN